MNVENKNKNFDCFITLKRWLENRNENKMFSDYFSKCGYQNIAIYGAGDLGKLLYAELKNSEIHISYFIDRNAEGINNIDGLPVITIQDIAEMDMVDVVVITPIGNYEAISKVLAKHYPKMPTLSLGEAVYEL